ncbi:MAG: hypothetical protein EOP04_20345 [Proteobacteria bacterium]|nr:MAG: hypothetical protein EOP04_20345 [Pseudomonadota bacterium]
MASFKKAEEPKSILRLPYILPMAKRKEEPTFLITVSERQLREFHLIVDAYKAYTVVPEKEVWKVKSNNDLWMHHIGQVMVVGGAISKERFDSNEELQAMANFDVLKALKSDDALQRQINEVLRKAGVRYAGKDYRKCAKSRALAKNLRFLSNYNGGLKGLLEELSNWEGQDAELRRVDHLMQHLAFMKSKSARDFLMGLGMNQNTLALDIRIANVMRHVGVAFPTPGALGKETFYRELELQIIEKLCHPLRILPLLFDRLLFQHEGRIIRSLYRNGQIFKQM